MKLEKTSVLCLIIGLISISISSCDEQTEPNIYVSNFYINDTSDSLFVDFNYSYNDYKNELQKGNRSYSLGVGDTVTMLYGENPDDITRADTLWMKNSKGSYLFLHIEWNDLWNDKFNGKKNGEHTNRYFFIDDSTLAKCDSMIKRRSIRVLQK